MSVKAEHRTRRRALPAVTLLAGAMAIAGCATNEQILSVAAVAVITAPVWYPPFALGEALDLAAHRPSAPDVTSSSPVTAVRMTPVKLPKGNGGYFHIYPYGPGRFMLLYQTPESGTHLIAWVINAADATISAGRLLPDDFMPLGVRNGSLVATNRKNSQLMVLEEGSMSIHALPLPSLGCDVLYPSPHLRFAACLTDASVATINLESGQVSGTIKRAPGLVHAEVGDDGRLVTLVDFGDPSRGGSAQNGVVASSVMQPGHKRTELVQDPLGRQLFLVQHDGDDTQSKRIAVKQVQDERVLFDVPFNSITYSVHVAENGQFALVGHDSTVVATPAQGAFSTTLIRMHGEAVHGASWDATGEWLILLSSGDKAQLFRFKPMVGG